MEFRERKQNRLKNYDYSQKGSYFVTICTYNKECFLGNIVGVVTGHPIMKLSKCGKIVDISINNISNYYDNISVGRYCIMPNHVHLIININLADENGRPMTSPTLSNIINQMKGYVTKQMACKVWQSSYHDHVIRNEQKYQKICKYIDDNPAKWVDDCYYRK